MKPNFNEGGIDVATDPRDGDREPAAKTASPRAARAVVPSGVRGWVWSLVLHGAALAVGVATAAGPMLAGAVAPAKDDVVVRVGFGEAGDGGRVLGGERAPDGPFASTSQLDHSRDVPVSETSPAVDLPFDFAPTTPQGKPSDALGMGGSIVLRGSRAGRHALLKPADAGASGDATAGAGGGQAATGSGAGNGRGSGSGGTGNGTGNGGTTYPVAESCPAPEYPEHARRRGWEGTVRIEYTIGASGAVESARVIASSGHPSLDEAGLATVRGWRYTWTGLPAKGYTTSVRFVFELR